LSSFANDLRYSERESKSLGAEINLNAKKLLLIFFFFPEEHREGFLDFLNIQREINFLKSHWENL